MVKRQLAAVSVALAVVVGGYATADAYDVVPGVLTLEPPIPPPPPYPNPTPAIAEADPPSAPVAHTESLQPLVDDFVRGSQARGHKFGIRIVDLASNTVLGEHDANGAHTTASTIKLLPASAALLARADTPYLQTDIHFDANRAEITLVGGGDMRISEAKLRAAAQRIADKVTTGAPVRVLIDDHLFVGPALHSQWSDIDRNYVQPVMALGIDSGLAGGVQNPDPALTVGETFATALREAGIEVSEVARSAGEIGGEVIETIVSEPLSELVRHTLKASDNTTSEVLARLVALARGEQASAAAGSEAVLATLTDAGFSTSGVNLGDTCGLDSATHATATVLTELIRGAALAEHPGLHVLLDGLPVAHLDGTLSKRMQPLAGAVRAKTGTLTSAVSLAGIAQHNDGAILVFAVLMDDIPTGGVEQARAELDDFIAALLTS